MPSAMSMMLKFHDATMENFGDKCYALNRLKQSRKCSALVSLVERHYEIINGSSIALFSIIIYVGS